MLIAFLIIFPMLAAPALYALGRRRERSLDVAAALVAAAELMLSAALVPYPQTLRLPGIFVSGLQFAADGFRSCYGLLASLLWLGTTVFSREYFAHEREHMGSYWAFVFLTLGAVQGLFLSADFLTAFVFFEILSLSSFPWVMHERTPEAIRAGKTYLAVAIFGGMVLFFGLLLLMETAGTLVFAELPRAAAGADPMRLRASGLCILLGFGAKAGMFPLHIWLPKAHPVAPAPASALLSGMLTKAGVFGVLMTALYVLPEDAFFGALLLILGLLTMLLGAILALFSVNLKRVLACSSMSQIGFILTGIAAAVLCRAGGDAQGADLALSGAVLHMVNHSLLKLVLFLCAGAVAMNLHTLELNEIRGWGWNKPALRIAFTVAALGISGVPFFNGYLSKTLLHEGLTEAIHVSGAWAGTEWIFLFSGGLTFAYMLKLYLCIFHEYNADPVRQRSYDVERRCMTALSSAVVLAGAALLLPLGAPLAALPLAGAMTGEGLGHFGAFGWGNLGGAAISLGIGAAVYLGFARPVLRRSGVYRDLWPRRLDLEDGVYRPFVAALCFLGTVLARALEGVTDLLILILRRTLLREERVRDARSLRRGGALRSLEQAAADAMGSVRDNFSFAMMMTCVGIILIFAFLLYGAG